MLKTLLVPLLLVAATGPTFAAIDRATAVTTLARLFNSAEFCNLSISRAKVQAYQVANTPADDALFNVDVFRATHDLSTQQKSWTKEQTATYCKTAVETAKTLDMGL
ncbi:MAG: hypothetical protein ABI398_08165 [Devosia sp.]